jgi:hypothetical protein
MRRLNGWLSVFWIVMIPISLALGWRARRVRSPQRHETQTVEVRRKPVERASDLVVAIEQQIAGPGVEQASRRDSPRRRGAPGKLFVLELVAIELAWLALLAFGIWLLMDGRGA